MPLDLFEPSDTASLSALKGLSILVTGGASGLGESTSRLLAEHGAYITMADVKDGTALATELTDKGQKAQYVRCDITDYDSQIAAFKSAIEFSGKSELDAVLAFAGVDDVGPLVDYVAASDDIPAPPSVKAIDVNVKGTFYTATLALHFLRSKSPESAKKKSFLIVASMASYVDDTHNTSYTTSKFGLRGLFRSLRGAAYSQLNLRVNALCPWGMYTPMTAPILDHLATLGIVSNEGKGLTLVPHEVLTQAAARTVVAEGVWGRGVAIMPEGAVDLGDDLEGGYGGEVLKELMGLRKEDGDFLTR